MNPSTIIRAALGAAILTALAVACFRPLIGDRFFRTIERAGERIARQRSMVIGGAALAAIVARLAFLAVTPVPIPKVHDEFSYLLAADTYAHGRLTNPPHALPIFFDTIHVNQAPTYMSKYPPAQGAVLAIGQLLGNPWIGVLLSVAAMCAAVLWMLYGWLPPRWAFLVGILFVFRFAAANYWIDSYWGGAVPAIGGALVLGALSRIIATARRRDALWLALGVAILANSRPYEGAILCVPVGVALAVWLFRHREWPVREIISRTIVPLALGLLLTAMFIAYNNWRVAGNALVFPYSLNDRAYLPVPHFIWSTSKPPMHYENPQFEAFYNQWTNAVWEQYRFEFSFRWFKEAVIEKAYKLFQFLLPLPIWIVLLPAFAAFTRSRRARFLAVATASVLAGVLCVTWFQPHYSAPLIAALFALLGLGFRYMRHWKWQGRLVGVSLTRAAFLCALTLIAARDLRTTIDLQRHPEYPGMVGRAETQAHLESMSGDQLAIVRYAPDRSLHEEWVYNRADVDHAKVVWAREIPGVDIRPLLEYFRGRTAWLVEPDSDPVRLTVYPVPTDGIEKQ